MLIGSILKLNTKIFIETCGEPDVAREWITIPHAKYWMVAYIAYRQPNNTYNTSILIDFIFEVRHKALHWNSCSTLNHVPNPKP